MFSTAEQIKTEGYIKHLIQNNDLKLQPKTTVDQLKSAEPQTVHNVFLIDWEKKAG